MRCGLTNGSLLSAELLVKVELPDDFFKLSPIAVHLLTTAAIYRLTQSIHIKVKNYDNACNSP